MPARSATGVSIPRSLTHHVRSRRGRDYRLWLAWPQQPPPPAGYPVIYVLDANATFGTFVEAIRMRAHRPDATGVGPAVVAGIAYPVDTAYERTRRVYDYTPAGSRSEGDAREQGGATEFLDFVEQEIKPIVRASHATDIARETLFGHSLGGRLVLQALCSSPELFETYVAVSPSIWWDREQLFGAVADLERHSARRHRHRDRRVMVTVGEYEQRLAPWQIGTSKADAIAERQERRQMVDDAREMAARLSAICGTVRFDMFPAEDHASVVPVSIGRAIRFCAEPRGVAAQPEAAG
jgi:predicted alpha/beta superfamily hydrolase